MISEERLAEISNRAQRAKAGPWYWHGGTHTEDFKTSDAGGLHTRTPYRIQLPDGRTVENDNVVFPVGKVTGDPYWLQRFTDQCVRRAPLSIEMTFAGDTADLEFIAHAREDIPALLAEIHRLKFELSSRL